MLLHAAFMVIMEKLINENTHERPLTVYALSKFSSEKEILKLAKSTFQVISLRFATLFGLSPRMRFDLGVNTMTRNVLQDKIWLMEMVNSIGLLFMLKM